MRFTGFTQRKEVRHHRYYACQRVAAAYLRPEQRCHSKWVRADDLETEVWRYCREWIFSPGKPLEEAQRKLRERQGQAAALEPERKRLAQELAAKSAEHERIMTAYRKGLISIEQAEQQIEASNRETAELRAYLDRCRSQQDLASAFEAQFVEAAN